MEVSKKIDQKNFKKNGFSKFGIISLTSSLILSFFLIILFSYINFAVIFSNLNMGETSYFLHWSSYFNLAIGLIIIFLSFSFVFKNRFLSSIIIIQSVFAILGVFSIFSLFIIDSNSSPSKYIFWVPLYIYLLIGILATISIVFAIIFSIEMKKKLSVFKIKKNVDSKKTLKVDNKNKKETKPVAIKTDRNIKTPSKNNKSKTKKETKLDLTKIVWDIKTPSKKMKTKTINKEKILKNKLELKESSSDKLLENDVKIEDESPTILATPKLRNWFSNKEHNKNE